MATNTNTTTYLLESLKRRGMLPSTDEALDTDDYLAFGNEELQTEVVQALLSVREEYLLSKIPYDQTLTASQSQYPVAPRAVAGKVRQVLSSLNSSGYTPLARLEPESAWDSTAGAVSGYKFEGNYITVVGTPSSTGGTLRQNYYMRPNRLVATSAVGQVSSFDTGTGVVTFASTRPSTFTTSERYDFVKGTPGFECLAIDKSISGTGGSTVTFSTSDLPSSLAVGDYVCLAGESPIPQVPVELHPFLSQRIVCRALDAIGDPKASKAEAVADRLRARAISLLAQRDESARRPIINPYGPGWRSRR